MAVFKTRARALDMLGRQQIAGIPTAISELFKNAHDAYADHVEVDFYRSDGLFVLRDDGLGMTKEEFETRWLILGTESKLDDSSGVEPPPIDPDKEPRPLMGEKGIGRLAIAAIGPQVLVLSRAKRGKVFHDLVAAFINWELFACPGIDLDQIVIPVETFPSGTLPSPKDVQRLISTVRNNIHQLQNLKLLTAAKTASFESELSKFIIDVPELDEALGIPTLTGKGHGTHFYILPAEETLVADIDAGDEETASPLTKSLIGFTNTMTPDAPPPRISTSFRDHKTEEAFEDLIAPAEFFTPEEFGKADHHIYGEFDELGNFRGSITVYGEPMIEYHLPSPYKGNRSLDCGPFQLNLAYIQGRRRQSTLPPEDFAMMQMKLSRIGGLYIYRDGVRVLPYGDSDVDFLELEKRRSKSASDYFFSYRRMFGVIQISRGQNASLTEKAGREGFRQNRAYRQFRQVLINFFIQAASEFFREGGHQAELFINRRVELHQIEKARQQQEKEAALQRDRIRKQLDTFFSKVDRGVPEREALQIIAELRASTEQLLARKNLNDGANRFMHLETETRGKVARLRSDYSIALPPALGLTPELRRDWETCNVTLKRLDETVFTPMAQQIEEVVVQAAQIARVEMNRRARVEHVLGEQILRTRSEIASRRREAEVVADQLRKIVAEVARECTSEVERTVGEIQEQLIGSDIETWDDNRVLAERQALEARLTEVFVRQQRVLESIREQLRSAIPRRDETGVWQIESDIVAANQEELLALREKVDADIELVQLGMAIEVVNHEFSRSVRGIRRSLQDLKAWGDRYSGVGTIYGHLNGYFEHLDAYLSLFTPLHRRLYTDPIDIEGVDIADFVQALFGERCEEHEIDLIVTDAFKNTHINGFPSTFYPVFINLLDNAIYWLKGRPDPRFIRLDAVEGAFLISDSGPGVSVRDREAIFLRGVSRKPGGQGMGLFISRQALQKVGYDLTLLPAEAGKGTTFRIAQVTEIQEDNEPG